jgi:thiamine biosynthesis lipoprotein
LTVFACAVRAERFEAAEPHMGTLVRITIYAPNASALPAAFARIRDLDEKLSDYKPDSELNQVCRTAHERPVHVSGDLFRVLDAAQKLAQRTDGAFDVTIGPVTHLWREGRTPGPEVMARCGYRNLVLDRAQQMVFLKLAGMQIDLGCIAKGYAADEALAILRANGIKQALVAVSGDLAIGDAPPGETGWRVGIEPAGAAVFLNNEAISTSGDTEQFREIGGVRYSHIIDPKTGLGLTSRIAVTVVAHRGIDADAMATAISVLGEERGRALLSKRYKKLFVAKSY